MFFTRFLFLKNYNLIQGHVTWVPTFQQYALTVRAVLMGLRNISCNANWMQNNVKETIVWHSIKKK